MSPYYFLSGSESSLHVFASSFLLSFLQCLVLLKRLFCRVSPASNNINVMILHCVCLSMSIFWHLHICAIISVTPASPFLLHTWTYIFFVKVIVMLTENKLLTIIQGFAKYSYFQNVIYKILWVLSAIFFYPFRSIICIAR